ncbi:MAG: potassium channel family protein [Pseudomonadota bacterium]
MNPVRFRLRIFVVAFLAVMVIVTVGFMVIEGLSLTDSIYFSIVTVATVGYGDILPATQWGKILAIFLIVMGTGTFLGVVANVTEMMLNKREKRVRLEKLNMVIGAFFSEVGTRLLVVFSNNDPDLDKVRKDLIITYDWNDEAFFRVSKRLRNYDYGVEIQKVGLEDLRSLLLEKRAFLVGLLENPVLMEHESFTELLRAVFHLTEELAHREKLRKLPENDKNHLAVDIKRAYNLLVDEWLDYMKHLKDNYPYLFSLAMRTNPFDRDASPIIE